MSFNPLAFMELFVVFAFAAGWGVLELVTLRMDRRRAAEKAAAEAADDAAAGDPPSGAPIGGAASPAGHPEGEQRLDPGPAEPRQ